MLKYFKKQSKTEKKDDDSNSEACTSDSSKSRSNTSSLDPALSPSTSGSAGTGSTVDLTPSTSTSTTSSSDCTKSKSKGKARTFLHSWKINREWLVYENGKMFCKVCREDEADKSATSLNLKFSTKNSFVEGSSNFKVDVVKEHECSKWHRSACMRLRNRIRPVEQTPAGIALTSLTKAQTKRVRKLMRNTHAIVKKARPFTDYEWMCR